MKNWTESLLAQIGNKNTLSQQALTRELSDHTPIFLDTVTASHRGNNALFKFELSWLSRDGFYDLIQEVWGRETRGHTPMQKWQNKIRNLRRFLRGWAKNSAGQTRKRKAELIDTLDKLDIKAEVSLLTRQELDDRAHLHAELTKLLREEEIYWLQRSKANLLLNGDSNTKFFHLLANGRHRKTRIVQLEQDEGIIVGDAQLKNFITCYYKNLFGAPAANNFSLDENIIHDIPHVSAVENELLTAPFTEYEIKEAVFQMEKNKAPGPDGFPAEFYQHFWEVIKGDLMELFADFHKGDLPIFSLNFGVISLLPKKVDAVQIQQFRPICLLNVSFKIFTKVLTNRITPVAQRLIKPTQTAFLPGRYILEGVVILHETLHELHRRKKDAVILKLDFEKASR